MQSGQDQQCALLPGRGFFGPSLFDCLKLRVEAPIYGIKLSLDQAEPCSMNLKGVELLAAGKPIDLGELTRVVAQSSVYKDTSANGPASLLSGQGMHTQRELKPHWLALFACAVEAEEIRIFNRGTEWGRRSRLLKVEVLSADHGSWQTLHAPAVTEAEATAEAMRALVAACGDASDVDDATWISDPITAERLRVGALSKLATGLRSCSVDIGAMDWPAAVRLVNFWWQPGGLSDDEVTVVAAYLLAQKQKHAKTSIGAFAHALGTRLALDRLENEMNDLSRGYGLGRYVITRHGVSRAVLQERRDEFLASLDDVLSALRLMSVEACICYGTLLGAVRDGAFIPHDDDVDVLYRVQASSLEEAKVGISRVRAGLEAAGFEVSPVPKYLNLHVRRKGGRTVDIFPCWPENGQVVMHMEKMKLSTVQEDFMFPLASVELYGKTFPSPANPERFLATRYGDRWKVSDKYFEWPWKLVNVA